LSTLSSSREARRECRGGSPLTQPEGLGGVRRVAPKHAKMGGIFEGSAQPILARFARGSALRALQTALACPSVMSVAP